MLQTLLPIFPVEAMPINDLISFCKRDDTVFYFLIFFSAAQPPWLPGD